MDIIFFRLLRQKLTQKAMSKTPKKRIRRLRNIAVMMVVLVYVEASDVLLVENMWNQMIMLMMMMNLTLLS